MYFNGKTVYVDENLSPVLVHVLRSVGINADRCPRKQADPYLSKVLADANGIILTGDKGTGEPAGFHSKWAKARTPVIVVKRDKVKERENVHEVVRRVLNLAETVRVNPSKLTIDAIFYI